MEIEEIWGGWPFYILLTGGLVVISAGVFVVIWHLINTLKAWLTSRAEASQSKEFQLLAERAVAAQESLAQEQQRVANELAEVCASVRNMERLLTELD